jgi:hypothetical protein
MILDVPYPSLSMTAFIALNFSTIGRTWPGLQKKTSLIRTMPASFLPYI